MRRCPLWAQWKSINIIAVCGDDKFKHVLQAIRKGQLLITLPRRCQLTAESSDPALQGLIDQVPQDLWAARLALPVKLQAC